MPDDSLILDYTSCQPGGTGVAAFYLHKGKGGLCVVHYASECVGLIDVRVPDDTLILDYNDCPACQPGGTGVASNIKTLAQG